MAQRSGSADEPTQTGASSTSPHAHTNASNSSSETKQQEIPKRKQKEKLKVLFLCTGNSCRSQMGEAWMRHFHSDTVEAYSAGIQAHGLNPNAVKVMLEEGIDITKTQSSKLLSDLQDKQGLVFDVVISVCGHADESCPPLPKTTLKLHTPFDDPPKLAKEAKSEEEALGHYRRVRDEIKAYVKNLNDLPHKLWECEMAAAQQQARLRDAAAAADATTASGSDSQAAVIVKRRFND